MCLLSDRLFCCCRSWDGEFWEWEVGDWRNSRMLRVVAIDNGDTSFVDVELMTPKDKSEEEYLMPTFILQTYPIDSRFMLRTTERVPSMATNSIRALVFAEAIPLSVTARIYDFTARSPKLVNESSMKLFKEGHRGAYYYTAPWQSERYSDSSGMRYGMQIIVEENSGSVHQSDMRFFSVEGIPGEFYLAFLGFVFFGFRWERVFPVLLWSMMLISCASLLIPKLFLYQLQQSGGYEDWVTSVFTPASSSNEVVAKLVKVPFWVMLEGARNRPLWAGMMTYLVFLIIFPWFSGRILGDDYPLGYMSLRGWTVQPSPGDYVPGLGVPDIMGIVLPYLVFVVFPLLLLLSALSAENVVCELHITRLLKKTNGSRGESSASRETDSDGSLSKGEVVKSEAPVPEQKGTDHHDECRLCKRFVRKGLVVGCLLVAYNHWRVRSPYLTLAFRL